MSGGIKSITESFAKSEEVQLFIEKYFEEVI